MLLMALIAAASAVAQPYCDVLLRPAFVVTTNGTAAQFSNVSITNGEPASAIWDFGDGTTSSPDSFHYFPVPGTYQVCLTLTTQDQLCSSTYCRDVVVPEDDCNGTWDAMFTHQYAGTNVASLQDISASGPVAYRTWTFGDGGSASNEESPEHQWLLPGHHFVSLTRTSGTGCVATDAHWVTVDGNASTCGQDLFVNYTSADQGGAILFSAETATTTLFPVIGVWTFGDGSADTAFVTTHVFPGPGAYQVCLFVGATDLPPTDTCFAYVCRTIEVNELVGVDEGTLPTVRAWPVPFASQLTISAPWLQGDCTVEVFHTTGQRVLGKEVRATGQVDLVLPDLPPAAYVVSARSASGQGRALVVHE
ncbi:MAG: PKD domain-containing protein [Flavobacteriales bacterium]|nr:PKD domain-containing protein [Flavobacteriales bacterium]